jgi:hypothetical protein
MSRVLLVFALLVVACEARVCVPTEAFSRAVQRCEVAGESLGCTAHSARAGFRGPGDGTQELTCFCVSNGTRISWPAEAW